MPHESTDTQRETETVKELKTERGRETETETERGKERERETERICIKMCVFELQCNISIYVAEKPSMSMVKRTEEDQEPENGTGRN